MGREVIDISMDKEPDPAVVYSNGDGPHNPGNEHLDPEENNGLKDYEVKECTMECPVEILDHPQVENSQEEQDVLCDKSTNYESAFPEDQSPKPEVKKQGNNKKLDKSPTLGNVRTNCTVPQPFSLATERRASNGTRPVGTETAAGGVNKTTNLQSPNSRKKSQEKRVFALISEIVYRATYDIPVNCFSDHARNSIANGMNSAWFHIIIIPSRKTYKVDHRRNRSQNLRRPYNPTGPWLQYQICQEIEFPLESRKPLQPDNKKHPDEDDTSSIASSLSSF
ncbi:hypothetical protein IFM89_020779 [Coptis chinensis]|uniref:Uncharacterized protein n=1 Tax=Coptis chinensis TaxID=261450 RepID=A0A835HRZ3_9MAGN|nr:hypothetical protein IFM89_020779 [Coptis chinensis]